MSVLAVARALPTQRRELNAVLVSGLQNQTDVEFTGHMREGRARCAPRDHSLKGVGS